MARVDKDQAGKKKQTEEAGVKSDNLARGKAPISELTCYSCGKMGHTQVSCRYRIRTLGEVMVCFKCRQPGHKRSQCPMLHSVKK